MKLYAALDKSGLLVYALKADKNNEYYCCRCKQKVKLITTAARVYFRHKNKCDNSINERLIHQKGKKLILDELSKLKPQFLEEETYLSRIEQRPDILVNKNFAVEYQCAKININLLSKRVKGYRIAGIKNIWILGGHYLKRRLGREHLKFITYNKTWKFYLLMLDSQQEKLTLFYNIEFIGPFNTLTYQKKIFARDEFWKIFIFRPKEISKLEVTLSERWLNKIRRKSDSDSQKLKLNFYNTYKITVEDYLKEAIFEAEFPIFATPAWQRYCGQVPKRLKQPLLKK